MLQAPRVASAPSQRLARRIDHLDPPIDPLRSPVAVLDLQIDPLRLPIAALDPPIDRLRLPAACLARSSDRLRLPTARLEDFPCRPEPCRTGVIRSLTSAARSRLVADGARVGPKCGIEYQPLAPLSFIADADFRRILESDLEELAKCMNQGAWKGAQVLAGSVLEAVLLDFLRAEGKISSSNSATRKTLEELLALAESAGLISERQQAQGLLIKDYRNLIHPGQSWRKKEMADENSAVVAFALLKSTVDQIEQRRRATYGPTATQLIDKVKADPQNNAARNHLLRKMRPVELQALLTAIPTECSSLQFEYDPWSDDNENYHEPVVRDMLVAGYRSAFMLCDDEVKSREVARIAEMVKTGTAGELRYFFRTFMSSPMLSNAQPLDGDVIVEYMIDHLRHCLTKDDLSAVRYIENFLEPKQCNLVVSRLCDIVANEKLELEVRREAWRMISKDFVEVRAELVEPMAKAIAFAARVARNRNDERMAKQLDELTVQEFYDPFADE